MKLDTTKVYYLGDLSDEQLDIFSEQLIKDGFVWKNKIFKNDIQDEFNCVSYRKKSKVWGFSYEKSKSVNALTLFKNERIAQIQLRIQELNNELIELDEEMRTLTYEL